MELISRIVWHSSTALLCAVSLAPATAADFEFREPVRRAYELAPAAELQAEDDPLWLAARERGPKPRKVLFSHRLVLQLQPGAELTPLLKRHGLKIDRLVQDDLFVVAAVDALTAARIASELAGRPEVAACYPIMRKQLELENTYAPRPDDYYYKLQAYHEFRDADGRAVGADINVRAAWPHTTGQGVTLAVADTGIQLTHPDIANQLAAGEHHNFATDADEGTPAALTASWVHGTSVAGLAAAEGNNSVGMIGTAPGAKVASWVIFDQQLLRVGEDKLMELYPRNSETVWVQNHSWSKGDRDDLVAPGLLEEVGIAEAIANGRGGKGVVMVRSGGNYRAQGRNASEDLYVADPRVIAVAAVNNNGRAASYSSPGAPLLISAPGGDVTGGPHMFTLDFLGADGATSFQIWLPGEQQQTLDLWNYRYDFNPFRGTSAAAPLVSGICAMMLSVNPNLTYRDVQHILALAARHLDTADPGLRSNGAGFLVSHNQGFGVIDAGAAVQLAKGWINRPPAVWRTNTAQVNLPIPDDGYRLVLGGTALPVELGYVTNLAGLGAHADETTAVLPVVDVGLANTPIAQDLTGKVALIERGGSDFSVKINHAAAAGAEFAIIFNYVTGTGACPGGDQLCPMGGTDFTSIPAVFIGNSQGTAIKNHLLQQGDTTARLQSSPATVVFQITEAQQLEHVGVRLRTDHGLRGDLRVSLVSPKGTRSVFQRYNADLAPGPVDWTYFSTHHFHESSVGNWRVEVVDQAQEFTGSVLEASLILRGVPITDSDMDGLDDDWENLHFTTLDPLPGDDVDNDGYSNAREQLMHTDPNVAEIPFQTDVVPWNARLVRLSWPGVAGANYEVRSGQNVTNLGTVASVAGTFPETVWFTTYTNLQSEFFQVRRLQ